MSGEIPTCRLGDSGLIVSRLCLGTMPFGARTDEAEAGRIYARAREAGINFIDTADVYAGGRSEEIVGRLVARERDRIVLASKLGNAVGEGPNERGLSRKWILQQVPRMLKRLGTDHLDILYLHREDRASPLEETVRALEDLHRSGMVLYVGVSNHKAWRVAKLVELCESAGIGRPVVCQPYYHALLRTIEVELLPACAHFGIGVFCYSPIARGVLTGKYRPGTEPPAESRAAVGDQRILETEFRPETIAAAEKVVRHAERRGIDPTAFATAFVLANPLVTGAVVGPRTLDQLEAYLGAFDVAWTAADEAAIEAVVPKGSTPVLHYADPAYPVEGRPVATEQTGSR